MTAPCILIVDDEKAVHDSYRYCLNRSQPDTSELDALTELMFGQDVDAGASSPESPQPSFDIEHAYQGEEAITLLRHRMHLGGSYQLAFVDIRMPPGLDGIETSRRLRELDPDLAIVICTAYSDVTWDDIRAAMPSQDKLQLLRKPFDPDRVLALAREYTGT